MNSIGAQMGDAGLPGAFADLEAVIDWALPTETERSQKRSAASIAELKSAYALLKPRIEDIMAYLDGFEFGKPLPEAEQRLYHLGLAFMDIAHPVELNWKYGCNPKAFPVGRFKLPIR